MFEYLDDCDAVEEKSEIAHKCAHTKIHAHASKHIRTSRCVLTHIDTHTIDTHTQTHRHRHAHTHTLTYSYAHVVTLKNIDLP